MTSAEGQACPASTRATAAGMSSMRRRPCASIVKKEKPSGTGAGTGRPAARSFSSVERRAARRASALPGRFEEERDGRRARGRVERLDHEQRIRVDEVEQRLDERLAVERAGRAAAREGLEHALAVVSGRVGTECVDDRGDALRDRQPADGLPVLAVGALEDEALRPVGRRPRRLRDLLQVVVVGQRPEDRDRRHAAPRELAREVDRVERLHEREKGPREEADLVSRRDGDGAAGRQLLGHLRRLGAATSEGRGGDARGPPGREQLPAALGGGVERGPVGVEIGRAPQELEEERRKPGVLRVRDHDGFSGLRASTIRRGESGPAGVSSKSPHTFSTRRPAASSSATSSSAA